MAIDQNSIPSDLRPLNLARTVAEEPRIPTAAAVAGLAGFPPNSMVRSDVGSPHSGPMYYPVTVLDSGGNPTVAWYPYHQIPLSSGGISETPRGNVGDQGVDEGVDDSSVKKVKLMCSFGGKILPRPNDGLLRYVGGQTRIISVRRDVSFQQLQHKMIDIYGQPVVIKYQLSNEDLDALLSVSCPEDLENMMEEYGKLVENGYGKLRVFLFSASELDSSGLVQFGDVLDSGQRYIDAINGIHDGVGGIARKESIASATSTQNSDGQMSWGEAVESSAPSQGDVSGIPSPCMTSPRVAVTAAHDAPTSMLYAAPNPVMYAEPPPVPMGHPLTVAPQTVSSSRPDPRLERPMPAIVPQQQPLGYNLQRPSVVDFQPPAGYVQAYVDPHQQVSSQIGYSNPQLLGVAGSMYRHPDPQQQLQANVVNLPPQQFIPAVHMTMAPTALHAGLSTNGLQHFMQPSQSRDDYPGENTFGARAAQFPVEQGITTYQPQTTVPLQTTGYGWNQIPPVQHVVVSDGWVSHPQQVLNEKLPKLEDCHMCQRGLPHAHSDTLAQEHVNNTKSNVSDANPVFHSSPVDGNLGTRLPNNIVVSEALGEKMTGRYEAATDQRAGGHMVNDVTATQLGVHGFAHGAELLHGKERLLHKPNNLDHTQMLFSQGMMGNPGDVKSDRSVLLGSNPQPHHEDNLQQPSAPLQYLLKQEVLASQPGGANGPPVRFIPQQTSESMVYDSTREYLGKLPFDGRIKIHTNPSDISLSNEQSRSSMNKLNKEDILVSRTQITGQDMLPSTECTRPGIVPDGNQNKLFDALPASSPEVGYFHNVKQLLEPNQVSQVEIFSTSGPYPHLNMGMQHLPADEVWYHKPTFSGDDSAHDTDSTLQTGVWKDEDPQFQSSIAPSGVSLSPSDRIIQDNWDAAPSNSLFSNHDPWTLRHDGHIPFPNTNQMPSSKEILNMRDAGVFQKPEGHLNKDFNLEHVRSDKEEHIKQELKAVAEGVAALVLQSPISAYASVHDVNELPPKVDGNRSRDDNAEAKTKTKVEDGFDIQDVGTKLSEKANSGLPISEGVGRLQIIKNSDLEELRELGSGTFGTVYHGKWRGSDVAIKRINDRCFDGKRSEEERMREDFWNEAIKLADLHHPNVVAFYGVVLDGPGGSVATVTEFMVNGSLRQALQRNDRALDKRKRLLIAMDVAFGMEYLHGKNIVHFDLKSDNLLVNLRDPHRPICKVGDLGLSKVKCHTLISGGVRGTLPWMAPELLNGSSSLVSEKVDVFSFGIVMWELLTGEEPYTDLHYGAIIGGIVSNTLRPAVPEYCDPEWRCLMERCWSAEPSERPSFTEVAKQLRLVTSSLPSKGQVQQQPQVQK